MKSLCHNEPLVIVDTIGECVAYCPSCRLTHVSNDTGKGWVILKDIQPSHPNPYISKEKEIEIRNIINKLSKNKTHIC